MEALVFIYQTSRVWEAVLWVMLQPAWVKRFVENRILLAGLAGLLGCWHGGDR